MAIRKEKEEIIVDEFENGIQPSPHKGIANIQNANISTEMGELINSYTRVQQSMTETAATGSLSYLSTDHVNLSIANTNNLFKGNWITVTNSSNTGQLPNGTYYVPPSTGAGFQLANSYGMLPFLPAISANILAVAGGGAGGGFSSANGAGGGGGGGGVISTTFSITHLFPYQITIGTGGAGGALKGGDGTDTTFIGSSLNLNAKGGGGGGGQGTAAGDNGGSGGGASGTAAAGGTGTVGQGQNGGTTNGTGGGGGGGGATVAGSNVTSINGGNGGAGLTSSISGASVTYGSGGGGGGDSSGAGTAGTGGSGAGNGGSNNNAGNPATASLGGGGGGASRASGTKNGGNGASGVVIISIPQSFGVTAIGGTHTTSGGNDIWTFTSSGTWTPTIPTTTPTVLTGFTAGLTATIQLTKAMGKPIAKATENYYRSGVPYNRYYILDNQNLVWVYDTFNETLYNSSDGVAWFLPDYQTSWCTVASGIAVIDGMLIVTAQSGTYGKPVVQLGGINTQTTNWVEFSDDFAWQGNPKATHTCFVGHQGYLYITDGNYIRSIFPDSTLITSVVTTSDNVQSMGNWTTTLSDYHFYLVPNPVDGTTPIPADLAPLPVVFFTDGALPQSISPNTIYYLTSDRNGNIQVTVDGNPTFYTVQTTGTLAMGATSATLTATWAYPTGFYYTLFTNVGGTEYRNVYFTNGSTAISWATGLSAATNTVNLAASTVIDLSDGAVGNQYYATFYPISSAGKSDGSTPLYILSTQRLALPNFEIAQCMAEIGNTLIIGCVGNVVYPWNQISNLPGNIISLPESGTSTIITVNQMAYLFTGNKANIYITDGSVASLVSTVPDYCAGIPGTPSTYIEPYFIWGGAEYVRGRVYFSILDQTATKTGNCGGIWSFVPTQNFYIGQDIGIALRLENQSSYNTYNGVSPIIIAKQNQAVSSPQYWTAWYSDISSPTYGIDFTSTGASTTQTTVLETDLIPTGTMLEKQTFSQIEFKLTTPLLTGDSVALNYRKDPTSTWKTCGTVKMEGNKLSGYVSANFEKTQWLQLQVITKSGSTSSFIRLKELRIRP